MRAVQWLAYTAFLLSPGIARADLFTFNATTDPITGVYTPLGSGHYNVGPGTGESFTPGSHNSATLQQEVLSFAQNCDPVNPPPLCGPPFAHFNQPTFFLATDGSLLTGTPGNAAVAIYDTSNELLAFVDFGCTEDVLCTMNSFAGLQGGPIDVTALRTILGQEVTNAPRIVATGGTQDAINAQFFYGQDDSFEFILPTPEPSSLALVGTVLLGFGARILRRRLPPPR